MSDTTRFAPNSSINASIEEMMPSFDDVSQRRMTKAIRDAGKAAAKHQDENTDSAARHIYREFIPAYVLNQCGYSLEYEVAIEGKTPDWLDQQSQLLIDGYTFERYGSSPFPERVVSSVASKCDKYESIAIKHSLSIVVSVHLDFISCIDFEDCYDERRAFAGVFRDFACLQGILFFAEHKDGIRMAGQPYGFFTLTSDGRIAPGETWPFQTVSVDE